MMSDGIPLFVFTGYEEKEIIQKSIAAGAMDCFLKGDNGQGFNALCARIGAIYIRNHVKGTMPEVQREKIATAVFETRKQQANGDPRKVSWLTTAPAIASLAVLIVIQLVSLFWFIWTQAGSNALFRKQVSDNTGDISILKQRADTEHEKGRTSEMDRAQLNARATGMDGRMNGFDGKLDAMRAENTQGFQKIYDLMLQDAKRQPSSKP
jgi:hypothetical protein